jgi:hypothetical protein
MSDHLIAAMQRSIDELLDGGSGDAVRQALRPILERAFRDGVRAGMELSSSLTQSAIEDAIARIVRLTEAVRPLTTHARRPAGQPRHRAISGAVGQAIELVLQERPGLRIIEIQQQAKSLDPTISATSVTNELRRKKDSRYRQDGKRWFLIGDTEKEEVEDRSFAAETESSVGGSGRAAA